jgi:phosphoglycerate dehydrogenase-like enzyme
MKRGKDNMKILVTMPVGVVRDTFMPQYVIDQINALGDVVWNTTAQQFTRDELRDKLKDIDVCICGWGTPRFDEYVLESAMNLKLIAHTAGSVANLVSDYLYERGIKMMSANSVFAESVAEGCIAYIMSSLRDLPYYNGEMQQGRWKNTDSLNESILDQTIGLVGFGMIARYLVEMLKPFRANIKVYSNHLKDEVCEKYNMKRASLEEIMTTCKIISIHTSKRPDTYHIVDEKLLKMIPEGALLVNTARGAIIDEEAMAKELQTGRFKAILDVYEEEPLPLDSKLRGLKNVILIPHMGGPTIDRRKHCTIAMIEDIKRFKASEPILNEIDQAYAKMMTQ